MIDIKEFADYLAIDKKRLDDELIQQPELFYRVSEAVAEAIAERDVLKEKIAQADAELDGAIRGRFEQDGVKCTEPMVKNAIQTSKRHKDSFHAYIIAKTKADKLLGLKESFKERNEALKELCGLYTSNYYQVDSVRTADRTDKAHYNVNRNKLAAERSQRG